MDNTTLNALSTFSKSFTNTINPFSILKVLGIGASIIGALFLIVWGAKLLINFISNILEQRRQHNLFYKLFYTKEITTEEFLKKIDKK